MQKPMIIPNFANTKSMCNLHIYLDLQPRDSLQSQVLFESSLEVINALTV